MTLGLPELPKKELKRVPPHRLGEDDKCVRDQGNNQHILVSFWHEPHQCAHEESLLAGAADDDEEKALPKSKRMDQAPDESAEGVGTNVFCEGRRDGMRVIRHSKRCECRVMFRDKSDFTEY